MYLPPDVTSSRKMARSEQARIPGCGSGEAVPDLTSLALEHPGPCSSHSRGPGTYAGAPGARAPGKNTATDTPLHRAGSLGIGGRQAVIPRGSVPTRRMGLSGRELWGGGGLSVTLTQSGWLSVCLSAVSKQGFPAPFSPLPLFSHYFPWASIILCFLIYSHCSRQTKEKEQWWSLGC